MAARKKAAPTAPTARQRRILFVSDIHIANYHTFSTVVESNITNRLQLFCTLADDLQRYVSEHGVNIVVMGGDLLDKSCPTPEENSVALYFLQRMLENAAVDVVIINGNHEVAPTQDYYDYRNSAVSILATPLQQRYANLHYVVLSELISVQGVSFHCNSWRLGNAVEYTPADVFVGHNAIIGTATSSGFIFKNGFAQEDLAAHYPLALCGDIHKPHLFEQRPTADAAQQDTRYCIQSGCLMQNEFGDDLQAGFWVIDIELPPQQEQEQAQNVQQRARVVAPPKFVHNDELAHGAEYYKFITLPADATLPPENERLLNRPTRLAPAGKQRMKVSGADGGTVAQRISVQTKFTNFLADNSNNIPNGEALQKLFDKLYTNSDTSGTARTPVGATLNKLAVSNFMSINELEYDFQDLDSLLILGRTGYGKTTLMAAVFYALTGSITKHDSPKLGDLPNWFIGAERAMSVQLDFTSAGSTQRYRIVRTYANGAGVLDLMAVDADGTIRSLRRDHSRLTQECIYDILGVDEDELFSMSYHSIRGNNSFVHMKNAERYTVISKLAQLDRVDVMREYLKTLDKDCNVRKNQTDGAIAELNRQLQQARQALADIMQASATANVDITALQKSEQEWAAYIVQLQEARNAAQLAQAEVNSALGERNALQSKQQMLAGQRAQLINEYKQAEVRLQGLQNATCYACGQSHIPADAQVQIQALQQQINTIVANGQAIKQQHEQVTAQLATAEAALAAKQATLVPFDNQLLINAQNQLAQIKQVLQQNATLVQQVAMLDTVQANCATLEQALDAKKPEVQALETELALYKDMAKLLDKKSAFIGGLLNAACEALSAELANVMADLPDYVVRVKMDKEITLLADINGRSNVGISNLSAGQTKLMEVSLLMAFINVYSDMYGLQHGLLGYVFLDEIFSFLDGQTLELAQTLVSRCTARQIIITHEAALQVKYPHVLLVSYDGRFSSYTPC